MQALGLKIRAGLHSGEIELHDDDVAGIAVHIGQRVPRTPARTKCLSREPSRTFSPVPTLSSGTRVHTNSKASPEHGTSSRWLRKTQNCQCAWRSVALMVGDYYREYGCRQKMLSLSRSGAPRSAPGVNREATQSVPTGPPRKPAPARCRASWRRQGRAQVPAQWRRFLGTRARTRKAAQVHSLGDAFRADHRSGAQRGEESCRGPDQRPRAGCL